MNINKLQATLEAVLFAAGEPLELERLSQALETDAETLTQVLADLSAKLDETGSGICLLKLEDKYQLCARKEYADVIREILEVKKNTPLSQAAFEVLAIIAYNQPITKSFIEQVRGVDCTAVIGTLCQKSLIEEKGRLDLPGRPLVYGTTPEFLRCFCISSLDELPPVPDGKQMSFTENREAVEQANSQEKTQENEEKMPQNENDLSETVDENDNLG
ncbi:MAG: SMC-Scp complex subunit ScpB [Clostridia bacterium]|nr:SMC-Scp complex subunit ScpB [Clostridia bacterium]